MQITDQMRRDPKFIYLSDYFTPEEAATIVANKIPWNSPGYVPSVMVPPGKAGACGSETLMQAWASGQYARIPLDRFWGKPGAIMMGYEPQMERVLRSRYGMGMGAVSLLDVAGDIEAPTIAYDPSALWRTGSMRQTTTASMEPSTTSPGASYPTNGQVTGGGDQALSWVEDNWMLLAGGLVALIALGAVTK